MRVAILADIHGNLPAFEAILEHISTQRIEQIIIAGDIVNCSPDSAKCWHLARSIGCSMVRGNHERYVFDYGTPHADPLWETERFSTVRWTAAQFSDSERQEMAELPLVLQSPQLPDLFVTHASPRSDQDSVKADTSEHVIAEMFHHVTEQTILRGHNHLEYTYHWQGRRIITVGAAGLPLDSRPLARYSILERANNEWIDTPQAIPYDLDKAVRRFRESGYLDATYPMGRLFLREVATASHTIVPFMHLYTRWQEEDPQGLGSLSLADAIDYFLTLY